MRVYFRPREKYDAYQKDIVSKFLSKFKSGTPKRRKLQSDLNSAELELNKANRY